MIEIKKPKVILYDYTNDPEKAIGLAVSAWSSDNFIESKGEMGTIEANELAEKGIKAFHRTALEFVSTTWILKNVSRAFQQQLTRTRHASFSIQSMRVILKAGFAENGHYTMPSDLDEFGQEYFHEKMLIVQNEYDGLIANGMQIEEARGILPMNIHSDISMCINLNALYHMLGQRLCVHTQWEFRQVAAQMKQLVKDNLGELFSAPIDAPCVKTRNCPMAPDFCGTSVWTLPETQRVKFYKEYYPK